MFKKIKKFLNRFQSIISETDINHRSVATIKLFNSEYFQMPQLYDIEGNYHKDICSYSVKVPAAVIYSIKRGKCIVGCEEVFTEDNKVIKEITSQKKKSDDW